MASKKQRQRELERARYQRRMARREQRDAQVRKWTIGGLAAVIVLGVIVGAFFLVSVGNRQLGRRQLVAHPGRQHDAHGQRHAQREQLGGGRHRARPPLHVHEQPAGLEEGGNAARDARLQGHVSGDNSHQSRQYRH